MFYAFYETPMLRTVHVMCYVFILHQWKNLLTLKLAGLMYPWCWSVILTFLANKSVIIYFFINTKRITCHFEFVLMCAISFFYLNGKLFLYYFFDMLFIDTYSINHTVHCVLFKTSSFWIFSLSVPNCFINIIFA